jgi:hypothetical protein
MSEVYGKALRCGSNQSQATRVQCRRRDVILLRHGIEHIVGLGVGTRDGHNCFLPSVRVKSHLLLPRIYFALPLSNCQNLHHHALPRHLQGRHITYT